jgi:putative transposase
VRLRLYPNREQETRLLAWESSLRFVWNLANEQRLMGLARTKDDRVFLSAFAQAREITLLRKELAWLRDVPFESATFVLRRLEMAWRRCFLRAAKRPRFKEKGRDVVSIGLDHRHCRIDGRQMKVPKLGWLRVVAHRPLIGKSRAVSLVREGDQWFAVFVREIEAATPPRLPGAVGLDRGIVSLVADSEGRTIEGPRFAERSARKLKRAQRALARTKKGSSNRAKARLRLARVHRTVRRQRAWLQHQISHDYANSHGTVVIEKLETDRMTRSAKGSVEAPGRNVRQKAGLNRSILDAGWSGLAEKLRYKLAERGGELVEVPAAYTSQTCSACGVVDAASRRTQSEFCCTACGHEANADTNAARVILSRWNPPIQPVEACDGAAGEAGSGNWPWVTSAHPLGHGRAGVSIERMGRKVAT